MRTDQELTTPDDTAEEGADGTAAPGTEARNARDYTDGRDATEARDAHDYTDGRDETEAREAHDATEAHDYTEDRDATDTADTADTADAPTTDLADTTTVPARTAQPIEDPHSETEPREPELTAQGIREDGLPGDSGDEHEIFERWSQTQILFVKDPSSAVAEADALIGEIVEARRRAFDAHRASVTDRWQGQGAEPDTEDLRLVLQDYRKILSVLFPRQQV